MEAEQKEFIEIDYRDIKTEPIKLNQRESTCFIVLSVVVVFIYYIVIHSVHNVYRQAKKQRDIFKQEFNNDIPTITIEQLRSCKGFENVSDEEAIQIINTLQHFTILTYKTFSHEQESKRN